jgi:hypothetical protein
MLGAVSKALINDMVISSIKTSAFCGAIEYFAASKSMVMLILRSSFSTMMVLARAIAVVYSRSLRAAIARPLVGEATKTACRMRLVREDVDRHQRFSQLKSSSYLSNTTGNGLKTSGELRPP